MQLIHLKHTDTDLDYDAAQPTSRHFEYDNTHPGSRHFELMTYTFDTTFVRLLALTINLNWEWDNFVKLKPQILNQACKY